MSRIPSKTLHSPSVLWGRHWCRVWQKLTAVTQSMRIGEDCAVWCGAQAHAQTGMLRAVLEREVARQVWCIADSPGGGAPRFGPTPRPMGRWGVARVGGQRAIKQINETDRARSRATMGGRKGPADARPTPNGCRGPINIFNNPPTGSLLGADVCGCGNPHDEERSWGMPGRRRPKWRERSRSVK